MAQNRLAKLKSSGASETPMKSVGLEDPQIENKKVLFTFETSVISVSLYCEALKLGEAVLACSGRRCRLASV